MDPSNHAPARATTGPAVGTSLGRLSAVDLRNAWDGEATEFTPWLAQPENIVLLGDTIGIELQVEAQEARVGPFRADILCRDTTTSNYVLIENQLERTDHGHLGQLLTYAAGLDAVTIVWVAARITDEHRAALDWLNAVTGPDINFFGLEIELWQIGDSPFAPKFNVVSKPNDWSKTIREQASSSPGGLTTTNQLNIEFWTQFRQYLEDRGSPVRINRPSKDHWTYSPVGRTGFSLSAVNSMRDNWSAVELELTPPNAKEHFKLIQTRHADGVEARWGTLGRVEWRELPNNVASKIRVIRDSTPSNMATWPELNQWMATALEVGREIFVPIVKVLDATELEAPENAEQASIGQSLEARIE
jgi:hypothetical protein